MTTYAHTCNPVLLFQILANLYVTILSINF